MCDQEGRPRVAVGSGNPVKRRAVEAALPEAVVESVPVDSGVPEQPRGRAETLAGAENRARNALREGEYDYAVGIEGGVDRVDGDLFLIMWAAATDGDRLGRGAGPGLALPAVVASRVRDGEELGPVMNDVLGTDGVARAEGAAGVLTGGRLPRADALSVAVVAAFAPLDGDLYR
ncbi:MAG: inosine/xanthosine triphosphatase [Salinigranum sp.]